MPVNIFKYDPEKDFLGAVETQKFFHGTSLQQLDAVTDLLMNFDEFARRKTRIADRVPPPMETKPADPPAETTGAE